jgi:hypothetical protein
MAGLEDITPRIAPINPASLIGNASPVVEPRAVSAMADAFRSGAITAQDIIDRAGELGKTKKKAELQILKEHLSPEAIAARQAATQAAGAQATLSGAQAGAATPLVEPQAGIAKTQLDQAAAEQLYGPGSVQAFHQLAPYVPEYKSPPTKPDGSPDFATMAQEGGHLQNVFMTRGIAAEHLKVIRSEEGVNQFGQKTRRDINAFNEDVSPGSPALEQWHKAAQTPFTFRTWRPGTSITAPTASVQPVQPTTPVIPAAPTTIYGADAQRAADQAAQASAGGTMAVAPVVTPVIPSLSERPVVGAYTPGQGIVTSPGEVPTADKIMENVRKNESYKEWEKALPYFESMKAAADAYNKIPIEEQRKGSQNLNLRDLQLAESVIKLYDPQGVVRQFKWDKIEQHQPWPEIVKNVISQAVRTGSLTPETRQLLIQTGYDNVIGREKSLIPNLQQAAETAKDYRIPLAHVLNPKEIELLEGKITAPYIPMQQRQGAGQTQETGWGQTVTLSNGMMVRKGPDGQYYKQ